MRMLALTVLLAGCGHSEPFGSGRANPIGLPFQGGRPTRLSLNLYNDNWPSWTPDGSRILYSAEQTPPNLDRCALSIAATGGTATPLRCPSLIPNGLQEDYDAPVSDGRRLAWLRAVRPTPSSARYTWTLWVQKGAGADSLPVQAFPYDAPSGHPHDLPRYIQWLKPGVLLYLGTEIGSCCTTDTLWFGEQAVLLDLTGPTPARTFIPGTERASAVSAAPDGSEIYYTFYGDSVVYRQVLATGVQSVLFNFGYGHVVRDPVVHGTRLMAVVDGKADVRVIPPFGLVQIDKGGVLQAVDLGTGNVVTLEDISHFFRHPRLSPSGTRLLAEGFPYVLVSVPIGPDVFVTDTIVTLTTDIWLWEE